MFVIKLQTMTQLERVKFIYKLLEQSPYTIVEIHKLLLQKNIEIGARQIYHDIQQMQAHFFKGEETIVHSVGQFNRKTFRLLKPSKEIELTQRDITTFQLIRPAAPRIIQVGRKESMDKFRTVYKDVIKKNSTFYAFMTEAQNLKSNFYEALYEEPYHQLLDDMIWSIANYKIIQIHIVDGDATSLPHKVQFPLQLKPILLIYHRGSHFIGGYDVVSGIFITIDTAQVKEYQLTKKTFPFKKLLHQAQLEIEKRFGISNNIDDTLYDIELEFTSLTGAFIKNYHWQTHQVFSKMSNGNWRLNMHCGINRELLGWLFQWMSNVKIHKPKKLIDLYLEQMQCIQANYENGAFMQYSNRLSKK
jgi:predicted DNA-binding transcriptional regulator YafY